MPRTVQAELLGHAFRFDTGPGLFSPDRVDDGTRLLLAHLPSTTPSRILDLGCGYGALGLPVAAAHPSATMLCVDRDADAVAACAKNASLHALSNVSCSPSVGYRETGTDAFDWILCNVPARIGEPAIDAFIAGGCARLTAGGELRIVVITDLAPVVERVAAARSIPITARVDGPRHVVFAFPKGPAFTEDPTLYVRDTLTIEQMRFDRHFDASEAPEHVGVALPLLLEVLPKKAGARVLVWRGGYGVAAVTLARRGLLVTAGDRDLLALDMTRRNAGANGVSVSTVVEGRFEHVVAELDGSLTDDEAAADITRLRSFLVPRGTLLLLAHERTAKRTLPKITGAVRLSTRKPYETWQIR